MEPKIKVLTEQGIEVGTITPFDPKEMEHVEVARLNPAGEVTIPGKSGGEITLGKMVFYDNLKHPPELRDLIRHLPEVREDFTLRGHPPWNRAQRRKAQRDARSSRRSMTR